MKMMTKDYEYKQVIVVRKDLNMRKGKLAAQVAHASVGSLTKYMRNTDSGMHLFIPTDIPLWHWLSGRFTKIVVGCVNEIELFTIMYNAKRHDIETVLITDAGFTEFNGIPTNTCLAVGPDKNEKIDEVVKHLKLL
jgi:PTH2 family peptidyl-tRNA hydrolase